MNDLSEEARAFLDDLRTGDDPSPSERAAVHRALLANVAGLGVAATLTSSAAASTPGVLAGLKVQVALSFLAGLTFGVVVLGALGMIVSPDRAPAAAASRALPATIGPPRREPAPSVPASATSEIPDAPAASANLRPRALPAPVAIGSAPPDSSGVATTDTLNQELVLIRRAHEAIQAGRPAQALVALNEHARRFPSGTLSEERDGMQALALCAVQEEQGRAPAQGFLRLHPNSPLAARIRSACGL